MKCRKCHGECNNVRWASVYCNGVYMSVGGIASNLASKHDYAIAMANGETFHKYDSEDDIQVLEYNHCFLCGYSNYSTRVKYKVGE